MAIILPAPASRPQLQLHADAQYLYVNQYLHQGGKPRCRPLAKLTNSDDNRRLLYGLYPQIQTADAAAATA